MEYSLLVPGSGPVPEKGATVSDNVQEPEPTEDDASTPVDYEDEVDQDSESTNMAPPGGRPTDAEQGA
jgi:hypothetical protein